MLGAVIDTRVVAHEPDFGLTTLEFQGGQLHVPYQGRAIGEPLRVHILSKDVSIVVGAPPLQTSVLIVLEAIVDSIGEMSPDRPSVDVKLNIGCPLLASITRRSLANLGLTPGQRVYAQIKALALSEELSD